MSNRPISELTGVVNPTDLLTLSGGNSLYAAIGHNHSGTYQPLDANLTSLADLTFSGSELLVLRVNAAGTALELAAVSGGGASAWGELTGTLADQTDLQAALDAKSAISHNHDAAYAALSHSHNDLYYTEAEVDTALDGKLNHTPILLADLETLASGAGLVVGQTYYVTDQPWFYEPDNFCMG